MDRIDVLTILSTGEIKKANIGLNFICNNNIGAICSNYLKAHYSRSIKKIYITVIIASFVKIALDEVTM